MKTVHLNNPKQAQQIFIDNGWTDKDNYFIQVDGVSSELMLNYEENRPSLTANSLNIGVGSKYTISLDEFVTEVFLELKNIDGLGALLTINQTPYFLSVYRMSDEIRIKQIGELYPELRIVDFGSAKNEGVKNLDGIIACSNLNTLNLDNCKNLLDISGLQFLSQLQILWLDGFSNSSQFHFISTCRKLRKLSQINCQLTSIEHILELHLIEALSLAHNSNLTDLSPLLGLKVITYLDLESCENLTDIYPLTDLTEIKSLYLNSCNNLTSLSSISGMTKMANLNLKNCENITDLSPLAGLSSLVNLNLHNCENITDLSPLSGLSSLKNLNLSSCKNITDLTPISSLKALTHLDLNSCKNITDLTPISELKEIAHLNIGLDFLVLINAQFNNGSDNITDLSPLSSLKSLNHLVLSNYSSVTELSPISSLTSLSYLDLNSCLNLTDLSALGGMCELTNLNLASCKKLTDLSPISDLNALATLNLNNCESLTDLSALEGLSELTNLSLASCKKLTNLYPISNLSALTSLSLDNCESLSNLSPVSNIISLTHLYLSSCKNIIDLSPITDLILLRHMDLSSCENIIDLSPLIKLVSLENLILNNCLNITDLSPISKLKSLTHLDLSCCENITRIKSIVFLLNLKKLELTSCSNIRDFNSLESLSNLEELRWIDPVACSQVLMQSATNRQDSEFILNNIYKWIAEIELSKDPLFYVSELLNSLSLLHNNSALYKDVCASIRSRGLQSEGINDLDAFTWETWCNLVLELELPEAINCLKSAVTDLDIQRETEVVLGPVIIASSELIEKHPSEKSSMSTWVNEQLQQLQHHPIEERQIAPSAAVFFASLNMKEEVLFWLEKATDEKAPLWRDKVLAALINYYAQKEEFAECRRLLDLIEIEEQRDKAISSIAVAMGEKYPVEAAFLLDDIKELSISTATANRLLQQSSVLSTPQGIYQLLLHLQSNPEELASTIETLIEKDQDGKVAHAVKQMFLQKQPTGPSAALLLELCQHPSISDFVKPRVLEKFKTNLQDRFKEECVTSIPLLLAEMQQEEMIDEEEAVELLKLMQQS